MLSLILLAAVTATNLVSQTKETAKITSDKTWYNRKDGIVVFSGHVHVDDSEYQMHADKAYVFLNETNALQRIVTTGHVVMTNGQKRAFGEKVTYRHDTGLVVLHAGTNTPAEVREVTSTGDRILRGKKIRFWINQEQVEVLEADITAPRTATEGIALPIGGVR